MSKLIYPALFFLLLFFASLFFSCNKDEIPAEQSKIICILFDLSETTNKPEIRKNYLDKFSMVLNSMHSGDAIEAALITEKSLSEMELSIECEMPVIESKADTELFIKAAKTKSDSALKLKKDSLLIVADTLLFRPKRKISNTEILNSLQVAERIFKSFPQPKKILVIFSDMIEDSRKYNFEREKLTEERITKIINIEKEKNLLPDLKDVKVYIAGASHSNSDRYNMIKNFWFEYFKNSGADLETQNYGAALIRFEE